MLRMKFRATPLLARECPLNGLIRVSVAPKLVIDPDPGNGREGSASAHATLFVEGYLAVTKFVVG